MKKSKKLITGLLAILISGCANTGMITTLPGKTKYSENYYSFSEKALTSSYLSRKFNDFLSPVNEQKILKELQFGENKEPELVKDVINMNPGIISLISPLTSVSTFREASPAFAFFMNYLEQEQNQINTIAGNGYIGEDDPNTWEIDGGYGGDDGPATEASFNQIWAFSLDSADNIYISDYLNHRIRRVDKTSGTVITIAGTGSNGDSGDNVPAKDAEISLPGPSVFDKAGNFYFSDEGTHRIKKITAVNGQITPNSIITTIAGQGYEGFAGDGQTASDALFSHPWDLAFDHSGNLFMVDVFNRRIRKLEAINGFISPGSPISTIAGKGDAGSNDDGLTGYEIYLNETWNIVFDKNDNLFIAEYGNNKLRKLASVNGSLTTESIISTIAGTGEEGDGGDEGPAIEATLNKPSGITFDHYGNLLFTEYWQNKIKFIDKAGNIHTMGGDGSRDYSGDGGPVADATFNFPYEIKVDKLGNIFVGDVINQVIRKINK
jgi:hypothetical protein